MTNGSKYGHGNQATLPLHTFWVIKEEGKLLPQDFLVGFTRQVCRSTFNLETEKLKASVYSLSLIDGVTERRWGCRMLKDT